MLAISTDTVESHKAFAEMKQSDGGLQDLGITMVEDKTWNIRKKFNVFDMATHQAFPAYVIIDNEEKVVASFINNHNIGGNPQEVVSIVKEKEKSNREDAIEFVDSEEVFVFSVEKQEWKVWTKSQK